MQQALPKYVSICIVMNNSPVRGSRNKDVNELYAYGFLDKMNWQKSVAHFLKHNDNVCILF